MRIIPVLDLKGGRAVHARAGDRSRYQPLRSIFCPEPDPVGLARGMLDRLGMTEVYIADLDAIEGQAEPAWKTLRAIADLGVSICADLGIKDGPVAAGWHDSGVTRIVAGLETTLGPEALARIGESVGWDRLTWSLDLRDGVPILANDQTWTGDPRSEANLVAQAVAVGVQSIIRLDLASVGTNRGVASIPPVSRLEPSGTALEWISGGGVTGRADLLALGRLGYSAALVGSALHDGRIDFLSVEEMDRDRDRDRLETRLF